MPKLELTYLQIREQAARDIRRRTEARQAQLVPLPLLSEDFEENEDFEETESESEDNTDPIRLSYIPQLFFLVLLLCFLLYHESGVIYSYDR